MAESSYVYLISPTFQFMNISGKPQVDGYVNIFISGTRSKYYAHSDFEGTLHPFNIPLNALGSAVILVSPAHSYDIYVYNSLGVLQMSRYNVTPATGEGTVISDVTTITSQDRTVDVTAGDSTEYDLSVASALQSTADTVLGSAKDYTDNELSAGLANKKDKQTALEFSGSATKTVKKITQNVNGEMDVEFEEIDLPQEAPNVNVTSTDNSIEVSATVDPLTNTKTFDISVASSAEVEYGRFIASDVTATATLTKTRGNIELSDNKIQLKRGTLYHFTVRGSYRVTTLSNTLTSINFIEYSTWSSIQVNVDNTVSDPQFFEISFDVMPANDLAYPISFSTILNAKITSLEVDVHSVAAGSSSGGDTPTPTPSADVSMEMCETISYLSCTVFNSFSWTVNGNYYTGAYNAIQTVADLKLIEGTSTITAYKQYNAYDHFQAVIYEWNPEESRYELVAYTDRYESVNFPSGFVHLPITHVIKDTMKGGMMYYVGLLVKSNNLVPLLGSTLPSMTWANPVPQFTKNALVYDDEANAIPAATLNTTYAETDKTESVFVQIHSSGVQPNV